jgi:hypothetical protein
MEDEEFSSDTQAAVEVNPGYSTATSFTQHEAFCASEYFRTACSWRVWRAWRAFFLGAVGECIWLKRERNESQRGTSSLVTN